MDRHILPSPAALCAALALVGAGMSGLGARAADLVVLADPWCPYNCDPDSDRPGYAVEIARAIFAEAGRSVAYRTLTWSRSIAEVRDGHADALIGATPRENPGLVFPREPIGLSALGLAVRADSDFHYAGPASLDGRVLGIVASYSFGGPCGAYITAHQADHDRIQIVTGADALRKNLEKLQAGRLDIVIDDANVLASAIAGLGPGVPVRLVSTVSAEPVYIAFSPAEPEAPALAATLDAGLVRLRASGRLATILQRYHLRDWR